MPLHRLREACLDLFWEVLFFLPGLEAAALGETCQLFRHTLLREDLWEQFCRQQIARFRGAGDAALQITRAMASLGCRSHRSFFITHRRAQFPLLGWFGRTPLGPTDEHRGEVFLLLGVNCRVFCARWDPFTGEVDRDASSWVLHDETAHRLELPRRDQTLRVLPDRLEIINTSGEVMACLQPLPPRLSPRLARPSSSVVRSVIDHFSAVLGLHQACYSSMHGFEVVHLSILCCEDTNWVECGGARSLQLQGRKVIGDRYVPAGQLSFCVSLDELVDPAVAVTREPPLCFAFDEQGLPFGFALRARLPSMDTWARGCGQINRSPEIWRPEWVDCSLFTYREPLPNSRTAFSVLWGGLVRGDHKFCMDFRPVAVDAAVFLHGANESVPVTLPVLP